MGDLQLVYGFCVFFTAATLLLMAYTETYEDVEIYLEGDDESGVEDARSNSSNSL